MSIPEKFLTGIEARLENPSLTKKQKLLVIQNTIHGMSKRTAAIKAFCYECIGYTTFSDVRDCQGFGCPLYFTRPNQNTASREKDNHAGTVAKLKGFMESLRVTHAPDSEDIDPEVGQTMAGHNDAAERSSEAFLC